MSDSPMKRSITSRMLSVALSAAMVVSFAPTVAWGGETSSSMSTANAGTTSAVNVVSAYYNGQGGGFDSIESALAFLRTQVPATGEISTQKPPTITLLDDIDIHSTLTIDVRGVTFNGGNHIIKASGFAEDAPAIKVSPSAVAGTETTATSTLGVTGVTIQNLTVKGPKPKVTDNTTTDNCGIVIDPQCQATLQNITVSEFVLGIDVKAQTSDFASFSTSHYTRLKGMIDVSNNAFGGICITESNTTLYVDREDKTVTTTVVNSNESKGTPTVWGGVWSNTGTTAFYAGLDNTRYYLNPNSVPPAVGTSLTKDNSASYTSPAQGWCNVYTPYTFTAPEDANDYRVRIQGAHIRAELYRHDGGSSYTRISMQESAPNGTGYSLELGGIENGKTYRLYIAPGGKYSESNAGARTSIKLEPYDASKSTASYRLSWRWGIFYEGDIVTSSLFNVVSRATSSDASDKFTIKLIDSNGVEQPKITEVGSFKVVAEPTAASGITGNPLEGYFEIASGKDISRYQATCNTVVQLPASGAISLKDLNLKVWRWGAGEEVTLDPNAYTLATDEGPWFEATHTENGGYQRGKALSAAPSTAGNFCVKIQGTRGYSGSLFAYFTADAAYGNPNGVSLDSRDKVTSSRLTQNGNMFRGGLLEDGKITTLDIIYDSGEGSNTWGSPLVYGTDFEFYGYLNATEDSAYRGRAPELGAFQNNGAPTEPGKYWVCLAAKEGSAYSGRTVAYLPLSTRQTNLYYATVSLEKYAVLYESEGEGMKVASLPQFSLSIDGEPVDSQYYDLVIYDNNTEVTPGSTVTKGTYYSYQFKGKNGYEGGTYFRSEANCFFPPTAPAGTSTRGTIDGCTWEITDGVLTIKPTPGAKDSGVIGADGERFRDWPWNSESPGDERLYLFREVVVEDGVTLRGNPAWMFSQMENLRRADLRGLALEDTTSINGMFSWCISLKEIIFGAGFNTESVTDWENTFYNCINLKANGVNWEMLDFSKAVRVSYMFANCKSMVELPKEFYFAPTVKESERCFYIEDSSRNGMPTAYNGTLGIAVAFPGYDWEANNRRVDHKQCVPSPVQLVSEDGAVLDAYRCAVCGTYYRDEQCTKQLDATAYWKTFGGCRWIVKKNGCLTIEAAGAGSDSGQLPAMTDINTSPWYSQRGDIKSVFIGPGVKAGMNLDFAFAHCHHMEYADLTNLDGAATFSFNYMFMNCSGLEQIKLPKSGLVTEEADNLHGMFYGCLSLQSIDISGFDTRNVRSAHEMFLDCGKLKRIQGLDDRGSKNCNFASLCWAHNMFNGCVSLKSVVLTASPANGESVAKFENADYMFKRCRELKSVTLRGLDFSEIEDTDQIFYDCPSLEWVPEGLCLAQGSKQCFWTQRKAAIKLRAGADSSVTSYDFAADKRIVDAKGIEDAQLSYKTEVLANGSTVSMDDLALTAEGAGIDIADFTFGGWYAGSARYDEETREWVRDEISSDEEAGPSELGEYTILLIANGSAGSMLSDDEGSGSDQPRLFTRALNRMSRMAPMALAAQAQNEAATCYGIVYLPFSVVSSLTPEGPGTGGNGGGNVTPPVQKPEQPSEPQEPKPSPAPQPGNQVGIESGAGAGSVVSVTVPAGGDGKGGRVEFVGSNEPVKNLKVPSTVEIGGVSYKVTAVANNAFKGNTTLRSVVLSKSVTVVGNGAFRDCKNLRSVTLGSATTKIGDKAFRGCTKLVELRTGSSVKIIGKNALDGCKSLTTLSIGRNVKDVGTSAIRGCGKLTTIIVRSSKLSKLDIRNLVKGTKVTTIKCYGLSKKVEDNYAKWAKAYKKSVAVG